jgi:magnesium-transporting ATPase (P-type)
MNDRSRAEEDLRVIRTLMERATTYRAISAPTALVGGVLSIAAVAVVHLSSRPNGPIGHTINSREFVFLWIAVLILTVIANVFFVWREASSNGRPFLSPGMQLALRAIAPNLIVPALFTAWFLKIGYLGAVELELVVVWVVFYGLALLSTALFAPRSLAILGWAFLLTGVSVPVAANAVEGLSDNVPNVIMALTFGLYHVIYAGFTWSRRGRPASDQLANE